MAELLNTQVIREYFDRYIRPHSADSIFVTAEDKDYILEVAGIYVAPAIPKEQLNNIRFRYQIEPEQWGSVLMVIQNRNETLPEDSLTLTTSGLYWFGDRTAPTNHLPLKNISMAYPKPVYPSRGLKIITSDKEYFISLLVHEALLCALANFLSGAQTVCQEAMLDLNAATLDDLLPLIEVFPSISRSQLRQVLQVREEQGPFTSYDPIAQLLHLSLTELEQVKLMSTLNSVSKTASRVRKVDC